MTTLEKRAKNWTGTYPRLLDNEYTNDDVSAMIENSYIQGATDQHKIDERELVHEPNNEEGITSAELAHQLYGAKCQKKIDLDKAVEVYTNELHQIIKIVNGIGEMYGAKELGEVFSVEGCIEDFRKAMED